MTSTTLERLIVIVAIIIGVIAFYFVLSDINSIISSGIRYDVQFSMRITMLEKIQEKYHMQKSIYLEARRALFNEELHQDKLDLQPFFSHFPRSLRKTLKYSAYSRNFRKCYFSRYVDPLIINCIGDAAKSVKISASIPKNP